MRIMSLGLIASMMLLPAASLAQTSPQPPAAWIAFEKQENAKRIAFIQQMKADQEAFLSANPQVKAYLDQRRAAALARMAAWRAAHPGKSTTN